MDLDQSLLISKDLAALKKASGSNAKQDLVKSWTTGYHREFIDLVGNDKRQWYVTWGKVKSAEPSDPIPLEQILHAAEHRLATPTQTAERLKALLEDGWPGVVLKAIVDKTFDAGISVSSIKKAQGAAKRFTPSLCADWLKMSDKKRRKLLVEGDYFSTPKMDGLRCVFKLHSEDRGVYSRSLKPLYNLDHHLRVLEEAIDFPCIVDGEAFAADGTWNSSMTGTKRKGSGIHMIFYPFDLVARDEVDSMNYTTPARDRWALMEDLIPYDSLTFEEVVHTKVHTPEEVQECFELDLADGWEGSVLHDASAVYACKRSNAWIKCKQFFSSEFTIVGFIPGTGKHLGRLGAIMVTGEYEGRSVTAEVGTGFSDAERQELWDNQADYLGATAEIKSFEVTEAGSLRFPSFLRIREDE